MYETELPLHDTATNIIACCLQCLAECREKVCKELRVDTTEVELSMGMSGDFEQAVSGGPWCVMCFAATSFGLVCASINLAITTGSRQQHLLIVSVHVWCATPMCQVCVYIRITAEEKQRLCVDLLPKPR